ncbi:MAG: tRNA (adenosine(37)-N6)-threonylcarbamoyltransferase complex transferase subunit TsaD [Candidatus Omnitrophica bacterium]|nr:tRNA (adenosine(37)-N6)-threonylcarbamoyltransferase complex transferase subunit TsaD [Candidatus Omnitrophota bacterium]
MRYTLGIETSCDETACAVLKGKDKILSNVISSSLFRHKPFGGVVPEIASRHCLEAIDYVYQRALKEAGIKPEKINLVAVTRGPGLIGSIFVGVSFAKALSFSMDIPLIGVNHIEAHLEANFIGRRKPSSFIGVIVSGGHTSLVRYRNHRHELLGETVDDAIGEAYDKVAKILGLGYPGGPMIDRLAQKGNAKAFSFTRPRQAGRFDFSFSGIKTAVLNLVEHAPLTPTLSPLRGRGKGEGEFVRDLCASFQEAVMQWVVEKTILACEEEGINNVVVGGGVSANSRLRFLMTQETRIRGMQLFLPPLELTTDNAAMIARLGYTLYRQGVRSDYKMIADPSLKIGEVTNGTFKHRH